MLNADEEELYERIETCQKFESLLIDDEFINNESQLKIGVIQSPNYPRNYPRNENCIFTLRGSRILN